MAVGTAAADDEWTRSFARYLIGERNLSALTAYTYEANLLRIERWTGKHRNDLTVTDVRQFLRESGLHAATRSASLVALKSYLRFGMLEGWWGPSPILAITGPKLVQNPKAALSAAEARTLLGACRRPNDYRVIWLGLYGGLRISESAFLTLDDWLPDRLRFVGKGRKVRDVPVHPALVEHRAYLAARPASAAALKHICRSLSHVTQVSFTSHSLRRTFSTQLSEARVPREVIGAILGHAPASVTERYAPVRFEEMVEAVSRLAY